MTATEPLPPQNVDAEENVLGAMMLNGAVTPAVLGSGLKRDHFYRPSHSLIYEAVLALYTAGKPTDPISVVDQLGAKVEEAGGADRVHELGMLVPAASNAGHWASIVVDSAVRRQELNLANALRRAALDGGLARHPGLQESIRNLVDSRRLSQAKGPFALCIEDFLALESEVPVALIGDEHDVLLPAAGFLLLGGRGGRGKTTLTLDAVCHLASGRDWLGLHVPRAVRILILENEGPQEPFRRKLAAKLATWPHPISGAIFVHVADWGGFSLKNPDQLERLRSFVEQECIELIVGDPLDLLGLDGVGSPEDTRDFLQRMQTVGLFESVAWWLLHHLRKDRALDELDDLSGAWGGRADAVLVIDALVDSRSRLSFPKVRWGSSGRRDAFLLAFDARTESFEFICTETDEEERDFRQEITDLLAINPGRWLTAKEIAAPRPRGIGANVDAVKHTLGEHVGVFHLLTGAAAKDVGRHPSATVYQLREKVTQAPGSPESPEDAHCESGDRDSLTSPYRKSASTSQVTPGVSADSNPEVTGTHVTVDDVLHDAALAAVYLHPYGTVLHEDTHTASHARAMGTSEARVA
jgi:hypothetical protein